MQVYLLAPFPGTVIPTIFCVPLNKTSWPFHDLSKRSPVDENNFLFSQELQKYLVCVHLTYFDLHNNAPLMIILSAQDLEDYGIRHTASTITFMGKAFVRGQTFAQRLRKMAIAMAEESMARGAACLLVDFETHITVWREQQKLLSSGGAQTPEPSDAKEQDIVEWIEVSLPPKPQSSRLKYRGQAPSVSPLPEAQAISRLLSDHVIMYRGQPVDLPGPDAQLHKDGSTDPASSESPTPKKKHPLRYRGQLVDPDSE